MKKLEIRRNITTRLKQVCVCADDVVLVTRTKQALTNTFQKLKQEAEKYGLVINQNKIKQNKIQEALKNANLWEGYGNRNRRNEN